MNRKIVLLILLGVIAAVAAGQHFRRPLAELLKRQQSLSADTRKELWEIEHRVLVFKKHGLAALEGAWSRGDRKALAQMFGPKFQGAALTPDSAAERQFAGVRSRALAANDTRLDAAGFVQQLLDWREQLGDRAACRLRLKNFGPVQQGNLEGPWKAVVAARLFRTGSEGLVAELAFRAALTVGPPTESRLNEGRWLRKWEIASARLDQANRPLFREVAAERGIDVKSLHDNWTAAEKFGNSSGGHFVCDYNRDGCLDLLVTDYHRNALYRGNVDGRFVDVTDDVGLDRSVTGGVAAAVADLDNDGWEDLLIEGQLYRNVAGERFESMTEQSNLRVSIGASGISVADFDRDGLVDLYVTNFGDPEGREGMQAKAWADDFSSVPVTNQLWRNQGNWQFENVTEASGSGGGGRSAFTACWLDANNDAWPDLYVINELGRGALLLNLQDGRFREVHLDPDGVGDHGSMGLAVGDVNGDGHIDLYVASMYSSAARRIINNLPPDQYSGRLHEKLTHCFGAGSRMYLNQGDLRFQRLRQSQIAEIGWSYGVCLADLNNDGHLDLYACSGFVSRDRRKPDG